MDSTVIIGGAVELIQLGHSLIEDYAGSVQVALTVLVSFETKWHFQTFFLEYQSRLLSS